MACAALITQSAAHSSCLCKCLLQVHLVYMQPTPTCAGRSRQPCRHSLDWVEMLHLCRTCAAATCTYMETQKTLAASYAGNLLQPAMTTGVSGLPAPATAWAWETCISCLCGPWAPLFSCMCRPVSPAWPLQAACSELRKQQEQAALLDQQHAQQVAQLAAAEVQQMRAMAHLREVRLTAMDGTPSKLLEQVTAC